MQAIAAAARVFKMGKAYGFDMDLLDIGGGFAGCMPSADGAVDLGRVTAAVNAALDAHFPPCSGIRIIAEPGR
jgi:diaminopimelate decarboxylase